MHVTTATSPERAPSSLRARLNVQGLASHGPWTIHVDVHDARLCTILHHGGFYTALSGTTGARLAIRTRPPFVTLWRVQLSERFVDDGETASASEREGLTAGVPSAPALQCNPRGEAAGPTILPPVDPHQAADASILAAPRRLPTTHEPGSAQLVSAPLVESVPVVVPWAVADALRVTWAGSCSGILVVRTWAPTSHNGQTWALWPGESDVTGTGWTGGAPCPVWVWPCSSFVPDLPGPLLIRST